MNWKNYERHPLSAAYPDITGPAFERLIDNLKVHGILGNRHVVLFHGQVLDGWQLLQACIAANVKPPIKNLPKGVDPTVWVETFNDHRRHEPMEVLMARAEERRKRVAQLRAEGKSTTAIADEVGVSQTQVQRDLAKAQVNPPVKVTGQDGKHYPQGSLIPELAAMQLSPKIKPILEKFPYGKQRDVLRDIPKHGMRKSVDMALAQREPGVDEEVGTNHRPKPGSVIYDPKPYRAAFGVLVRDVDALAEAFGIGNVAEDMREMLRNYDAVHRKVCEEASKQRAPQD
jgi:hypothetical protein